MSANIRRRLPGSLGPKLCAASRLNRHFDQWYLFRTPRAHTHALPAPIRTPAPAASSWERNKHIKKETRKQYFHGIVPGFWWDFVLSRPGKPNQRKDQNEKFMNFAHFCEFWCFSLGKQARFTLNFCSGMPPRKVHELTFYWFGLPGPLLILFTCFSPP